MVPAPLSSGNLRERPVPRVIYACEQRKLDGVVEIDTPEGMATLYLRSGWPCAVRTEKVIDTLGQVLLEIGAISVAAYHESLMQLARKKKKHGEILREMGALDAANLRRGLEAQLRRKMVRLFAVQEAPFRVFERGHEEGRGESERLRVDPRWAIVQGIKSSYTGDRLDRDLARLGVQRLRVAASFWPMEARYGLADEDRRALQLLRNFMPRKEFERVSGLGPLLAQMVLYALWVTDGIEVQTTTPGAGRVAKVTVPLEIDPATVLRMKIEAKMKALDGADHFAMLDVERNATPDAIKAAYMEMTRTFHPDRVAAVGLGEMRIQSEKVFARIGEAFRVLSDDRKRAEYLLSTDPKAREEREKAARAMEAEQRFQQGNLQLRRNDFGRAEAEFRAAVQLNDDEGDFHAALAWVLYSNPKGIRAQVLPEVRRMLSRARELSPRSALPHFYLGKIHVAEGNEAKALEHFREALELKTDYLEAEQEIRVITMRQDRSKSKGLFGGLFGKKK